MKPFWKRSGKDQERPAGMEIKPDLGHLKAVCPKCKTVHTGNAVWNHYYMGAFNLWVKGTPLEKAENRHVGEVANLLLNSCAYHYMRNLLIRMGAAENDFRDDILADYFERKNVIVYEGFLGKSGADHRSRTGLRHRVCKGSLPQRNAVISGGYR